MGWYTRYDGTQYNVYNSIQIVVLMSLFSLILDAIMLATQTSAIGSINSKINGTPQRFLVAPFKATLSFSRTEFTCT